MDHNSIAGHRLILSRKKGEREVSGAGVLKVGAWHPVAPAKLHICQLRLMHSPFSITKAIFIPPKSMLDEPRVCSSTRTTDLPPTMKSKMGKPFEHKTPSKFSPHPSHLFSSLSHHSHAFIFYSSLLPSPPCHIIWPALVFAHLSLCSHSRVYLCLPRRLTSVLYANSPPPPQYNWMLEIPETDSVAFAPNSRNHHTFSPNSILKCDIPRQAFVPMSNSSCFNVAFSPLISSDSKTAIEIEGPGDHLSKFPSIMPGLACRLHLDFAMVFLPMTFTPLSQDIKARTV
ncbi:uncharacterized protein BDR25DRAFT_360868 [Lindgomyces ingoldianus]|uniref:Uncharacterized protein n=1 Tax=Lindgomyces ingoldianus TaxID=673940 RepID=A0ACB6QGG9_9PLEO|nr:uncharacterized protein BDR25DRAFT_360868 [Lindgomyces ingoldianus]KAF2465231.1 hypothetical protein BDR25DRAFT_360868 [Lindgomyces ingoldianus]